MSDDAASSMIARIMSAHEQVAEKLVPDGEPSLKITVDDVFKKMLLICAGSYCEVRLIDILVNLYKNECNGRIMLSEFVKKQALNRRYHQLLDWDAQNANKLFRLLGKSFENHIRNVLESNPSYEKAEVAFVELGNLRNQAVHKNLATFSVDKSTDEIFDLYKKSQHFLDVFDAEMRRYSESG